MLDNFTGEFQADLSFEKISRHIYFLGNTWLEIVKLSKVEEESQVLRTTQCEEDHFEMLVRAANIVSKFRKQTIKLIL